MTVLITDDRRRTIFAPKINKQSGQYHFAVHSESLLLYADAMQS